MAKNLIGKNKETGKNSLHLLSNEFNYYGNIKTKSDLLYKKYNLNQFLVTSSRTFSEDIAKELFYNLNLNICNQVVYDYIYEYTKADLFFIADFKIDKIFSEILFTFREDVMNMQTRENVVKDD